MKTKQQQKKSLADLIVEARLAKAREELAVQNSNADEWTLAASELQKAKDALVEAVLEKFKDNS